MELHDSLKFSASKQSLRTQTFEVQPMGSKSAGPNGVYRFRLPERSLLLLDTMKLHFDATFTGLAVDASNWATIKCPAGFKFVRSYRTYVNGVQASGGLSNNYDQIMDIMMKVQGSEDFINSHHAQGYKEYLSASDDAYLADGTTIKPSSAANPTETSVSHRYVVADWLGLNRANGNGPVVLDSTLFGSVDVEIVLSPTDCILQNANGSGSIANINYALDNAKITIDCITQVSPLYPELISALVNTPDEEIRFPFQNFQSVVVTGSPSMRLQLNSGSVDALVYAPLASTYADLHPDTDGANKLNPPRYEHPSGRTMANAGTGFSLSVQVGSQQYPQIAHSNALDVAETTVDAVFHGSIFSQNLLYAGIASSAVTYSRKNFLDSNFIWIQPFSIEAGHQSKKLAGIDCANQNVDFIVNAQNAYPSSGYVLLCGLTTSVLTYQNGRVSVAL
jgi:hypothetical protein